MRVYEVLEENDVIRKILLAFNTSKITLDLNSPYKKTYRNIEKTGKIVLEPLKYIDFAYVNVDFTVEKFY